MPNPYVEADYESNPEYCEICGAELTFDEYMSGSLICDDCEQREFYGKEDEDA